MRCRLRCVPEDTRCVWLSRFIGRFERTAHSRKRTQGSLSTCRWVTEFTVPGTSRGEVPVACSCSWFGAMNFSIAMEFTANGVSCTRITPRDLSFFAKLHLSYLAD